MLPQSASGQRPTAGSNAPLYAASYLSSTPSSSVQAPFQSSSTHGAMPLSAGPAITSTPFAQSPYIPGRIPDPSTQHSYGAASPSFTSSTHPLLRSSMADNSTLSTHSTASASAAASRIEVRNVAELVRQLAESRHTARQLQQRLHQAEASTMVDAAVSTDDGKCSGTAQEQSSTGERTLAASPLPPPASSLPPPPDSPEKQQRPRKRPDGIRRRRGADARETSPSRRRPSLPSTADAEGGDFLLSPSSVSPSSSSSSSLLSTSTFLSTSGLSSIASAGAAVSLPHARRDASTPFSVHSTRQEENTSPGKRKAHQRVHAARDADQDGSRCREPSRSKRDTQSSPKADESRSAGAAPVANSLRERRELSHRSAHRHTSRTASRHRRVKGTARETRKHLSGGVAANPPASRHRHRHPARHDTCARASRSPSAHRQRHRHPQLRSPPGHHATSLSENHQREQEAKELKRARRWQRRYYDLMSQYADETAQREAELADIHDLIEYMSWEQDRSCLRHRLHTSAAAITDEHGKRDAVVTDANKDGEQVHKTPTRRETRGTSPQRAVPSSATGEAVGESGGVRDPKGADNGNGSSTPSRHLSTQAEWRRSPHKAIHAPQHSAADHSHDDESKKSSVAGEEEHSDGSSSSDGAPNGVGEGDIDKGTTTATEYVRSLRNEAEAWRLRCLELLQRQSAPNPDFMKLSSASYHETSHAESVLLEGTSSMVAMPPPLPPRPQQRSSRDSTEGTSHQPADLAVSCDSSVTPRTREAECGKGRASQGGKDKYHDTEAAPPSTVDSPPPRLSRVQYQRVTAGTNTSPPFPSALTSALPVNSSPGNSGLPALLSSSSSAAAAAPQLHRYAPPPELPASAPSQRESARPPTASAAAMHALYLATEQRYVDLSPLSSAGSPQRPPLFVGLPDYRSAEQGWYSPMKWSAATAAAEAEVEPDVSHLFSSPQPAHVHLQPPFSPYGPALFQATPLTSPATTAEMVVAREQLERDIRRHDQLLAAIGKLQKTASEHAARRLV
ncbi:hypothetical protein ABB37_06669 [Leptomonas pyrrhocoris]|uniref:Uncharacterized protein n=1 Tax=Leptomonas pyrrhocoris TaxID=157538 RepID=A0A0M9FXA7_LEPPY|nr:hypothetical protein ABB37_06669 [Leptomonas pyrrhocoris]XP_015656313.1 hypothetical protein ABB37_06669 [Leptomonas pyrrhocoris]KPA77873.1 hypothetical protein ABB37_06669 [Leptomonas pyrrhocoris]KPA77874.1 hypothetical protein ABB37_06669 [Leptomonas pyrrhocoris]|eukprot:XP_015656312.1 hypothetical protein ABB37_06669 [Leptomonas pyrrhocoris]